MQNESKHPPGSDEGQTNFEWLLTQLTPEEGKELTRMREANLARQSRGYELDGEYDPESVFYRNVPNALAMGFMWASTPQGFTYWSQVHEKYKIKEKVYGRKG